MKYTKNQLEKLGITEPVGIHDLRNLAREMGVKNPTAKKRKADLIADMLDIAEGRVLPSAPSKRGRPPINSSTLSDRRIYIGYATGSRFDGFKALYPEGDIEALYGFKRGQRALIAADARADTAKVLADLTKNCVGDVFSLVIDAPPEEEAVLSEILQGEKIISSLGTPFEEHIKTAAYHLSRLKQLAAEGRDVVLAVYGIDALYRAFFQKEGGEALTGIQTFFGAARRLEGAGSLTIIAFAKDSPSPLLDTLASLANAQIFLTAQSVPNPDKSFVK